MGKIFYIMGKSSSGKDTIYRKLQESENLKLGRLVLYTTRPIRDGEKEGQEYHFVDEAKYFEFDKAEKALTVQGYIPINPIKVNTPIEGKTWKEYMLDDIKLLFDCEAIFLLNNWQASKGARIEYLIAKEIGMTILMEAEQ